MKTVRFATVLLATAVSLGIAQASGPIAVYALIDKVTLEPNADRPERILISGVFITATQPNDGYSAPQKGFLYFTLPREKSELALREWADLKSAAGTREVVGFGSSWYGKARVRKPDEEAHAPDAYVLGNGVVKINQQQPRAKELLDFKGR